MFTIAYKFRVDTKFSQQKGNFQQSYWFSLIPVPETQQQRWTGYGASRIEVLVSKELFDETTLNSLFEASLELNFATPKQELVEVQ